MADEDKKSGVLSKEVRKAVLNIIEKCASDRIDILSIDRFDLHYTL